MSRSPIQSPMIVSANTAAGSTAQGQLLLPLHYLALIIVSSLDLIFTYTIIFLLDGIEINPIANAVLASPVGFNGLIIFKFVIVIAVIGICEFIARHTSSTARRLAGWAIAISAFPVVWSTLLLIEHL